MQGPDRARISSVLRRFHRSKKYVGAWAKYFQDRHRSVPPGGRWVGPRGRHGGIVRPSNWMANIIDLGAWSLQNHEKSRFSIQKHRKTVFLKNVFPVDCCCPSTFQASGNFLVFFFDSLCHLMWHPRLLRTVYLRGLSVQCQTMKILIYMIFPESQASQTC